MSVRVVVIPRSLGIPRRYWISAVAHGVLLTVWAWAPTRTTSFRPIGDSMTVGLVAAPPSGGGARTVAPPAPTPPAPTPVQPPPEPKGPSLQEPKKPKDPKEKDKKKEREKETAKEEQAPNTAETPTQTNNPPSSGPAAPGTGSGGAGKEGTTLSLGGGQPGADFYGSTVRAAIEAHWRKPVLDLQESPQVSIQFEILRDGTVRDVRVVSASGVPALDRSALRAVSEASPLPPFPASFRIPSTTAIIEFELQPE